jgi:hypothetical protein
MNEYRRDYALRIDGSLLQKQRQALAGLVLGQTCVGEVHDELEGVIALLDEIADQARDRYGIDGLPTDPAFTPSMECIDCGTKIVPGETGFFSGAAMTPHCYKCMPDMRVLDHEQVHWRSDE